MLSPERPHQPLPRSARNRIGRLCRTVALTLALLLSGSRTVRADETNPQTPGVEESAEAQARKLFEQGLKLYKKRKYKDAINSFVAADRLFPNPVLSFNMARAYDDLGDRAGALRFYRTYLRQSPDAADKKEVEVRIGDLENALRATGVQQVTIFSEPDAATVTLDDQPVGVTPWTGEIYPGKHRLKLSRDGFLDSSTEFELSAVRAIDVKLTLEPTPTAPPPKPPPAPTPRALAAPAPEPEQRGGVQPLTIAFLGVGTLSLAGAGVFELMRRSSENAARDERTQVARAEEIDKEESRRNTARILAGVGGVAVAVGGVLLVLDLSSSSAEKKPVSGLAGGCGSSGCSLGFGGRFE